MKAALHEHRLAVLRVRELALAIRTCPSCRGSGQAVRGITSAGACGRCQGEGEWLDASRWLAKIRGVASAYKTVEEDGTVHG